MLNGSKYMLFTDNHANISEVKWFVCVFSKNYLWCSQILFPTTRFTNLTKASFHVPRRKLEAKSIAASNYERKY